MKLAYVITFTLEAIEDCGNIYTSLTTLKDNLVTFVGL